MKMMEMGMGMGMGGAWLAEIAREMHITYKQTELGSCRCIRLRSTAQLYRNLDVAEEGEAEWVC
jgi:hypothetical protein